MKIAKKWSDIRGYVEKSRLIIFLVNFKLINTIKNEHRPKNVARDIVSKWSDIVSKWRDIVSKPFGDVHFWILFIIV